MHELVGWDYYRLDGTVEEGTDVFDTRTVKMTFAPAWPEPAGCAQKPGAVREDMM